MNFLLDMLARGAYKSVKEKFQFFAISERKSSHQMEPYIGREKDS